MKLPLDKIQTPAYVADLSNIRSNLAVAKKIKQETGCKMLLATKAFSMFSLFDEFSEVLDGTTASGLYEAQLANEHFHKEIHAYSPAFTEQEMETLPGICKYISFNTVRQLDNYAPLFIEQHGDEAKIGIRLNPQFSQVTNNEIYDPSSPNSRFGIKTQELVTDLIEKINFLHIHNLCENMSDDSSNLIEHLITTIPEALSSVSQINLGGGHYFTHPEYDIYILIKAINKLQSLYNLQVILEPGGALVYEAGYLVASVIDIINHEKNIAILDTSATCHMPDILEVPYRPNIIGDDFNNSYTYSLAGKTCLSGDVIGEYSFEKPLEIGDKIIFRDMLQYTMVKNTTFNGMPLPDIGILDLDGKYNKVKEFDYNDFKRKLS